MSIVRDVLRRRFALLLAEELTKTSPNWRLLAAVAGAIAFIWERSGDGA